MSQRRLGRARLTIKSLRLRTMGGAAAALGTLLLAGPAAAQLDTNPPLPDVILLVDTSGSMEQMPDGSMPVTCDPTNPNSDMNKWTTLVSVLTGTINNRGCYKIDRNGAAWRNEFAINNVDPYDYGYHLPHHRIVSDKCVLGPGGITTNIYDWDSNSLKYHQYDSTSSCSGSYTQQSDGLLDSYRSNIRFSLMTYDTDIDKGTGQNGGTFDASSGNSGTYSYFLNWNGGGAPATGALPSCVSTIQEVGARNSAAPPWEGRLIAPGAPDATLAQIQTTNDHIQQAIMAMRPYGATPLAGQLADAYTFLHDDQSTDPLDSTKKWAPAGDNYFNGGCRKGYIVVLSDGSPNVDLRPYCEQAGGKCPFKKPYEIAHDLANPPDPKNSVKVYAVGFGISKVSGTDCTKLQMPTDYDPGGKCYSATGALAACCNLARLAYEGGTTNAYYADDVTSLRAALAAVLSSIATGETSRTTPVFGMAMGINVQNSNANAVGWQFTSSFNTQSKELWTGNLERHRWQCKTVNGVLTPELQDVDDTKGDDFVKDVNSGKTAKARRFITVVGDQTVITSDPCAGSNQTGNCQGQNSGSGGNVLGTDSLTSIRPNIVTDEGLGKYSGTVYDGPISTITAAVKASPSSMNLTPMPAACKDASLAASSDADCANRLANWLLGGTNGGCTNAACPTRSGNEYGAIYHSTPAISTPPVAHLRDADYEQFALKYATRPIMLYTATTDGQIHAHKVATTDPKDPVLVDTLANNELWSFVPPYALPGVLGVYPNVQNPLIDGSVVVRDVVLDRSLTQAKSAGTNTGASWKTVLLAGGGSAGSYYEALDVTDPTSPKFLWQLSRSKNTGALLFGAEGTSPGIATIALSSAGVISETAVAIIPGGAGKLKNSKGCKNRQQKDMSNNKSKYKPRNQGHCWLDGPDQNLAVVRISDGKILHLFTANLSDVPAGLDPTLVSVAPFDAPLTGIPVGYPSQVGTVSNRIYLGDADGGLYRVDLSNPDPTKWKVDLIFDAYSVTGDTDTSGEPVQGVPILSVDDVGNVVIIYSTGDQNLLQGASGMKARIWSIVEKPTPSGSYNYTIDTNWFLNFDDGKRVTGPIAVFDGVSYFATYTPAPPNAPDVCTAGYGSLWGVHYKDGLDTGSGPHPLGRLPKDPAAKPIVYTDELKQDPGSVIYGTAVQMEPPCFDTSTVTDNYIGAHTAITNATAPTFSLLYHTGGVGKAYGGPNARTKANTMKLPTPRNTLRFDSWAAVAE